MNAHMPPIDVPERFEIVREIGRGSQKRVFLGYDTLLQREVALSVYVLVHRCVRQWYLERGWSEIFICMSSWQSDGRLRLP